MFLIMWLNSLKLNLSVLLDFVDPTVVCKRSRALFMSHTANRLNIQSQKLCLCCTFQQKRLAVFVVGSQWGITSWSLCWLVLVVSGTCAEGGGLCGWCGESLCACVSWGQSKTLILHFSRLEAVRWNDALALELSLQRVVAYTVLLRVMDVRLTSRAAEIHVPFNGDGGDTPSTWEWTDLLAEQLFDTQIVSWNQNLFVHKKLRLVSHFHDMKIWKWVMIHVFDLSRSTCLHSPPWGLCERLRWCYRWHDSWGLCTWGAQSALQPLPSVLHLHLRWPSLRMTPFILMRKVKRPSQAGRAPVDHLKPTLLEVTVGMIAIIPTVARSSSVFNLLCPWCRCDSGWLLAAIILCSKWQTTERWFRCKFSFFFLLTIKI